MGSAANVSQKAESEQEHSHPNPVWKILDHVLALATLAGLIMFGTLSGLYDFFYGRFGLDPADIGIGYPETLMRSWGFVALATLATIVQWAILIGVKRPSSQKRIKHLMGAVLAITCLELLFVWGLSVAAEERDNLRWISRGFPAASVYWGPFLMLDVAVTAVEHVDLPAGDQLPFPRTDRLMYLGSNDQTYVLYDARRHTVIRLPRDRATVSVYEPTERS